MVTKEVINYIQSEIQKGISRETIAANLVSDGGWKASDIQEAFLIIDKGSVVSPAPLTPQQPAVTKPPEQPITQKSFFGRIVSFCFQTKASSILTIIISIFLFFIFPNQLAGLSLVFGSLIFFTPLLVWIVIILALRMTGYTKEAENVLGAFARIFLAIIILGVVGFGVCLLLLAGFH